MGFAITWVCLALVCAVAVLVGAGRVLTDSSSESKWSTWSEDFVRFLAPSGLRIEILFQKLLRLFGAQSNRLADLEAKLQLVQAERRHERDIAQLADMGSHDMSNTSLDDFLRATATEDPAYVEVDALAETFENMYETVAERRALARARR